VLDPDVITYLTRPVRSRERLKRYFLEAAKFDMQEFFENREDDAKQLANVQASFIYGEERRGEHPEETCQVRWTKLMNVILPEKFNRKVRDMIRFIYNEHSIINRNMPFMFQKLDAQQQRQLLEKKATMKTLSEEPPPLATQESMPLANNHP
jgi:hypothetical protein